MLDFIVQIEIFKTTIDSVLKYQDTKSGVWFQVVDQIANKGNYLEASASSMFVYALAKGISKKYLSEDYMPITKKAYEGIIKTFIKTDSKNLTSLHNVCQVAGLGGHGDRDGSYEYYLSEPVIPNDRKGTGSFILASIEYEKLISR